LELYEMNRSQSTSTSSAIFELNEKLDAATFPRLTRPHFFVAHSNRADAAVKRLIFEVLDEFADRVEFTDWERMSASGNINTQIAGEIARSRFGICYLSEPADPQDEETRYADNPNVVFEAGMVHARTAMSDPNDKGEPTGWIPMREVASPPPPFDFAAERILQIPRMRDGSLNEGRLREMLGQRIDSLLGPQ
ncbi:MAG: TIR domain-containing protein, partial [Acidimicrobiia bacterium]